MRGAHEIDQSFGTSSIFTTYTTLPFLSTRTKAPSFTDSKVGDNLNARSLAALVARAAHSRSTLAVKGAIRGSFLPLPADLPFDLFVPATP